MKGFPTAHSRPLCYWPFMEGCDGVNYQALPPGRSNKLYGSMVSTIPYHGTFSTLRSVLIVFGSRRRSFWVGGGGLLEGAGRRVWSTHFNVFDQAASGLHYHKRSCCVPRCGEHYRHSSVSTHLLSSIITFKVQSPTLELNYGFSVLSQESARRFLTSTATFRCRHGNTLKDGAQSSFSFFFPGHIHGTHAHVTYDSTPFLPCFFESGRGFET